MKPIVKYSHDRIGQRWTLKDHAKVLEHVHEKAKAITELRALVAALEARVCAQ